jgi:ribose transport system substrate-binding protein
MRRRAFLGAAAFLLAACKKDSPGAPAGSPSRPRIAVIPKGTTHEFWKAVHAGAVKASREANVEIIWKGPLKEDDLKGQIDVVQTFTAQGVSGIVLAPLSDTGLKNPVKAAVAAGIPVIVFDSDLQGDAHASFVATDNVAAGKIAADEMGRLLGGKGNVIVLRYQEGSASTQNREKGFLDGIKAFPDIKVVSDNQYGGATTESAFATSESLLAAQKASQGNVQGVFAPNESTTFGMLLALRKATAIGQTRFLGFDASEKLREGLVEGRIDGLVVQNPFNIGYLAVRTMADKLAGKPIEKRIDTGAKLVTKANMNDAAIKELTNPDLTPWLGP